jgi:hypothetical protein
LAEDDDAVRQLGAVERRAGAPGPLTPARSMAATGGAPPAGRPLVVGIKWPTVGLEVSKTARICSAVTAWSSSMNVLDRSGSPRIVHWASQEAWSVTLSEPYSRAAVSCFFARASSASFTGSA